MAGVIDPGGPNRFSGTQSGTGADGVPQCAVPDASKYDGPRAGRNLLLSAYVPVNSLTRTCVPIASAVQVKSRPASVNAPSKPTCRRSVSLVCSKMRGPDST